MNTPRMTEKELAEHQRRVRISRSKTGWVHEMDKKVRSTGAAGRTRSMTAPNQSLGRSALPAPERSASSHYFP